MPLSPPQVLLRLRSGNVVQPMHAGRRAHTRHGHFVRLGAAHRVQHAAAQLKTLGPVTLARERSETTAHRHTTYSHTHTLTQTHTHGHVRTQMDTHTHSLTHSCSHKDPERLCHGGALDGLEVRERDGVGPPQGAATPSTHTPNHPPTCACCNRRPRLR